MLFILTTLAILSSSTALIANDIVILGGRVIDPETSLDAPNGRAIRNAVVNSSCLKCIKENREMRRIP
jgi:N-acyl-D-glutamate deacylase